MSKTWLRVAIAFGAVIGGSAGAAARDCKEVVAVRYQPGKKVAELEARLPQHDRFIAEQIAAGAIRSVGGPSDRRQIAGTLLLFGSADSERAMAIVKGDPLIKGEIATAEPLRWTVCEAKTAPAAEPVAAPPHGGPAVRGVGGIFFRSPNPKALYAWYEQYLGLKREPSVGVLFKWRELDKGSVAETVWGIFPQASKYFNGPFMVNYRVENLDAILARFRAAGVKVEGPKDDYGRFAWVTDPDGNRIELWEPPAP
jgi:predicted enzyme related to lactoylglutathione lyase